MALPSQVSGPQYDPHPKEVNLAQALFLPHRTILRSVKRLWQNHELVAKETPSEITLSHDLAASRLSAASLSLPAALS
jgi:hypothetical protein